MIRMSLIAGSGVPVPDIIPDRYENRPLVKAALGLVAIIGALLFLAQALVAPRRAQARGNLLIPFVVAAALMVVPLGGMFVLMKTGERAAFDRIDVWLQRDDAALETVKPQLERYYGITIHDRTAIPVAGQDSYKSAIPCPTA